MREQSDPHPVSDSRGVRYFYIDDSDDNFRDRIGRFAGVARRRARSRRRARRFARIGRIRRVLLEEQAVPRRTVRKRGGFRFVGRIDSYVAVREIAVPYSLRRPELSPAIAEHQIDHRRRILRRFVFDRTATPLQAGRAARSFLF